MDYIVVSVWRIEYHGNVVEMFQNRLGNYIRPTERLRRFNGKPMKMVLDYLLSRGCVCQLVENERRIVR